MQIYRRSCVTVVLFLLYRMILHHFGLLEQDFYSQPRKVCKTRPSSKDKTIYHMLVKCRTLETIVGTFGRITEATRKRHSGFLSWDFKVRERGGTRLKSNTTYFATRMMQGELFWLQNLIESNNSNFLHTHTIPKVLQKSETRGRSKTE